MEQLESRAMLAADGNDSRTGALVIGSFDGAAYTRVRTGSVGSVSDNQDYYRFTLSKPNRAEISLTGLTANLDFELQNSTGGRIGTAQTSGGSASESNTYALSGGTYYVRIFKGVSSAFSNYTMTLDLGDDTRPTARSLGSFGATTQSVSKTGHVGGNDTHDYLKFTLTSSNRASIRLSGLTSNLDLALQDSTGQVLATRLTSGTASESIAGPLGAGTYYVRVSKGTTSASSNYTLSIAFGDDSRAAASVLGTLAAGVTTRTGHVGGSDTHDYYQFSISGSQKNATIQLLGLSADLDIQLLSSSGTVIRSSTAGGTTSESISRNLAAGTYYVRVFKAFTSSSSSYQLRISIANFV